jgi:uncharacterized protein (DUF2252 family)
MTNLEVWYARTDVEQLRAELESQLTKRQRKAWDAGEVKARSSDSMQSLRKLTEQNGARPRLIASPPLIVPVRDLPGGQGEGIEAWIISLIEKYRQTMESDRRHLLEQYEFADMARKVVGVGSVGTRCWIVLMFGRDDSDPLFLQIKEAQASVLTRYVGGRGPANQGQRVVAGQRLTQAASDIFLGWIRVAAGIDGKRRDFYVRQLRDWKFSFPVDAMLPEGLRLYGQQCGWTLARAHARSGDRIAIAGYLGGSAAFDQAIAEFARSYADQNQRDYDALREAAASGRITVKSDV